MTGCRWWDARRAEWCGHPITTPNGRDYLPPALGPARHPHPQDPKGTTMSRFKRTNHGKGHSYTLDGARVAGVTTAIGKVLDKPALVEWAARESADYAVSHWAELSGIPEVQRHQQIREARWNRNREAIADGKRIHDLGERLAKGAEVDVPDELRARVEAYARFLDAWEIEAVFSESPVCHTDYRYAGTFDLVARVGKLDGALVLMDLKTGKGVYAETALQLTAYRYANLMLEAIPQEPGPRGGKRPPKLVERPMPEVLGCAVAHVIPETEGAPARVDFLPVESGPDVWSAWLYVLELYETWWKRTADHASPVYAPPIGEPVYPEQPNPFYEED